MSRSIARSIIGSGCIALVLAVSAGPTRAQQAPPADSAATPQQAPAAPPANERARMGHMRLTAPIGSLVDINHASRTELKSVPGITTALAGRIMANRPFGSKAQLVSRKIISRELYERVKDKIVVRFTEKELKKILKEGVRK